MKGPELCIFWQQGRCKNGRHCRFLHGEAGPSEPPPPLEPEQIEDVRRFLEEHGGQLEGGQVAAHFHGLKKAQLAPHFDIVSLAKGKFYVRVQGFEGPLPEVFEGSPTGEGEGSADEVPNDEQVAEWRSGDEEGDPPEQEVEAQDGEPVPPDDREEAPLEEPDAQLDEQEEPFNSQDFEVLRLLEENDTDPPAEEQVPQAGEQEADLPPPGGESRRREDHDLPMNDGEQLPPEEQDGYQSDEYEVLLDGEEPHEFEAGEGADGEHADGLRRRPRKRDRVRQGSKSTVCVFWQRGMCRNGSSCRFVHGEPEFTRELDGELLEEVRTFLDELGGQLEGGVVAARFHGLKKAQLESHFDIVDVGKGKFYVRIRGRTFDGPPPEREGGAEASRRPPRAGAGWGPEPEEMRRERPGRYTGNWGGASTEPPRRFGNSTPSKTPVPCRFFPLGTCRNGEACPFLHGPVDDPGSLLPPSRPTFVPRSSTLWHPPRDAAPAALPPSAPIGMRNAPSSGPSGGPPRQPPVGAPSFRRPSSYSPPRPQRLGAPIGAAPSGPAPPGPSARPSSRPQSGPPPCKFFARGVCRNGRDCQFRHS